MASRPSEFSGRVVSAVRWQALDQGVQQATRFVVMAVLAKLIAPSAFGVVALALVATELAVLLTQLGLGSAIQQRRNITSTHIAVAFTTMAAFGFLVAILMNVVAGPLASYFDEPKLEPVLRVMAIAFVCKGLHAVPLDLLRRELEFKKVMVMSTIATGLAGTIAVIAAFLDAGVWALVALSVGEAVGALVAVWALTISSGLFRPRLSLDLGALRDLFSFGVYVSANQLLHFGQGNFDNLIVGRVLGARSLGYYSVAYRLMLLPVQRIADVVSIVALPAFSTLQGDVPRLRAAFLRALRSIALVCFPASIGTLVAAPVIVELVFGTEWLPAVPVVQILALNGPRLALNRLSGAVLLALDRPKWDLQISALSFVLHILGFAIGVQWGIAGVAWGYTIAGHVASPLGLLAAARVLQTRWLSLVGTAVPAAVATTAMAAAAAGCMKLTEDDWAGLPRLAVVAACGAAVYAIALRVGWPGTLGGLTRELLRRGGAAPAPTS